MEEVTRRDRERELEGLLEKVRAHPERAATAERERIGVLQRMLAAAPRPQG